MTRLITLLSLGLAAACLPQFAAAQSVTLDPGLYDGSTVMSMSGRKMPAQTFQDCIRAGENTRTIEDFLAGLTEDGQCTFSNAANTSSTARVDYLCSSDEMPFDITGTMEVEYGADFVNISANGTFGPMGAVMSKTTLKRSGACPADWVDPVQGSDDGGWDE